MLVRPKLVLNGKSVSAPKSQVFNEDSVSANIFLRQIIQQSAAFPDDHLQPAATSRVVFVLLEMLCQASDSFGK